MAHLYDKFTPKRGYWDKKSHLNKDEWDYSAKESRIVYVGNLAFYTTEDQIHDVFSMCGLVEQVVMGLNPRKNTPCGFCFVRYSSGDEAALAASVLDQSVCDERVIHVDLDSGRDIEGVRRFGRGIHGMQWRDEFRTSYDEGRGGPGGNMEPRRRRRMEPRSDAPPVKRLNRYSEGAAKLQSRR